MSGTATQTLNARRPEDVLAAVPVVLGFVPEESVVMLTFDAEHVFNARIDLPRTARERREAAELLVGPAVRHRVRRVLFVVYAADGRTARACLRTLVRVFARHGIVVVSVLRSDGRRWFPVSLDGAGPEGAGTPYDLSGHLFTAQSVAAGRVVRGSREELAATVAPDPDRVMAVAAALADGDATVGAGCAAWLPDCVAGLVAAGGLPDPATAARVLLAVAGPEGRDAVLTGVDREGATRQVPLWSALVRGAPTELLGPAASVLAFLAWLAGDGALAWCAVERAREGDPPCSLADAVARALDQALPPTAWTSAGGRS